MSDMRSVQAGEAGTPDQERIRRLVRELLIAIGEDPDREGLVRTPDRVASMCAELFGDARQDPAACLGDAFVSDYDDMIMVREIQFASVCEHHLVPFFGQAHVAYVPGEQKRIAGFSKLARVVDAVAGHLQVQERMTAQIADAIETALGARGVLVVIEAEHLCMSMRGVRKPGSVAVTVATRGQFETDPAIRAQALGLLRSGSG
jgi:GTP cyclohydrolase I